MLEDGGRENGRARSLKRPGGQCLGQAYTILALAQSTALGPVFVRGTFLLPFAVKRSRSQGLARITRRPSIGRCLGAVLARSSGDRTPFLSVQLQPCLFEAVKRGPRQSAS
jgi:hypothetical protein